MIFVSKVYDVTVNLKHMAEILKLDKTTVVSRYSLEKRHSHNKTKLTRSHVTKRNKIIIIVKIHKINESSSSNNQVDYSSCRDRKLIFVSLGRFWRARNIIQLENLSLTIFYFIFKFMNFEM